MNSPVFTVTSDFSTPKPYFYQPHEISEDDEFSKYLSSLQTDISSLGKEVEPEYTVFNNKIELLKGKMTQGYYFFEIINKKKRPQYRCD